jgi:hypothetical protein
LSQGTFLAAIGTGLSALNFYLTMLGVLIARHPIIHHFGIGLHSEQNAHADGLAELILNLFLLVTIHSLWT